MKNYLNKILLVCTLLLLSACDGFIGGDTNVDPNRTSVMTLEGLLPVAIESTANNHYLVAYYGGQFSQHLASYFVGGSDSYFETRIPLAWTGIYLTALTTLDQLATQAHEQGAPHYEGVAKILQALNLGMATDCWGDVPFSTAFQGSAELTPSFDSQDQIYETIATLLDEAVALLNQPTSVFRPGTDDLVFGGGAAGIAKWIKVAYALKARYAIHYSTIDQLKATTDALAAIPLAISLNSEDLQLTYNTVNRNPWFNNVSSPIGTGNFTVGPARTIVNLMNGTAYPGSLDPRLSKLFDLNGAAAYNGLINGSAGPGGTCRLGTATFYAGQASILPMVTFAEMKFIEAEARFLANGPTQQAYDAYRAGIRAHMEKVGVDATSINNYLANTNAVAPDAASLTLQLIMKEKYIAMFLNPENWTDVRRYDYSNTIYRGMTLPENYNTALGGEFIRRVLYPLDEINRNSSEVTPHVKDMQVKMWWNQ
jgi:hypothetical protein